MKTVEFKTATNYGLMNVLLVINNDFGSFEISDVKTNGCNVYEEGGLWFTEKYLVDYDGIFELPAYIEVKLIELGYTIDI